MILQTLLPILSSALGVGISLFENSQARKAKARSDQKDRELEDKISERKQVSEFRELESAIALKPTKSHSHAKIIFWGKEFSWTRNTDKNVPLASPAQHANNIFTGMLILPLVYVICLFGYNAQTVLWTFAPTDATEHWSILWGIASSSITNPQIVVVTCGGLAVFLLNPILIIITRRLTGAALDRRK